MIRTSLHIVLLALVCICFASCTTGTDNGIPPLQETFSKTDKKPFGAFIAYHQLNTMYTRNTVRDKIESFDKTWRGISDTASLYVCITPALFVNKAEIKAMLDYVYAGNTLFIASNYIDEDLLKKVSVHQVTLSGFYFGIPDSFGVTKATTHDSDYAYFYKPFKNYFKYTDEEFTKVLGVNEEQKPNCILYFHGKGKLILHCDPKAFSNYFLLKNDNYKYMQNLFSYTSNYPDHLYWDDYYRRLLGRRGISDSSSEGSSFSSFNAIMKHPQLASAFWLSLLLLALYIIFGGKRRQRIIDKIKPNENTTVAFTETVGLLYLQNKDNKNIAEKMAAYFNEHIRNNYFLNTSNANEDFITALSRKSGVDRDKVESLYRTIHHACNNPVVDDYQLLSLNEQIQNFYKKK